MHVCCSISVAMLVKGIVMAGLYIGALQKELRVYFHHAVQYFFLTLTAAIVSMDCQSYEIIDGAWDYMY